MKKLLIVAIMALCALTSTSAQNQKQAEIQFETLTKDFGTFSENDPVQTCSFVFTNTGTAPLIINQASASCGCTVASYTKEPVAPGKQGKIDVTYNGKKYFPGRFKKTVNVRSNAKTELVRLYISGNMEEVKSEN